MPVNMFYGLRESIRLLEEEGLDNVYSPAIPGWPRRRGAR